MPASSSTRKQRPKGAILVPSGLRIVSRGTWLEYWKTVTFANGWDAHKGDWKDAYWDVGKPWGGTRLHVCSARTLATARWRATKEFLSGKFRRLRITDTVAASLLEAALEAPLLDWLPWRILGDRLYELGHGEFLELLPRF